MVCRLTLPTRPCRRFSSPKNLKLWALHPHQGSDFPIFDWIEKNSTDGTSDGSKSDDSESPSIPAVDTGETTAKKQKKNAGRVKSGLGAMTEDEVKAARKRLGKQVVDAKATASNGTEYGNQRPRKEKPAGKRVNYHVNKPVPEDFYVPKKKKNPLKMDATSNKMLYSRRRTLRKDLRENGFYCAMFLGNGGKQEDPDAEIPRACLRGESLHCTHVRTCL